MLSARYMSQFMGDFFLNEGGVAGYVNRMKTKSPAKWGMQIAGMIFQTHSSTLQTYSSVSPSDISISCNTPFV